VTTTPSGRDYDGDVITYRYTQPLNRYGIWKTNYEDQGNYTSYVTVSDGIDSQTKPLEIEVRKKNRAPSINVKDEFTILEGESVMFQVGVDDQDNDNLTVTLENMPSGATFVGGVFSWVPPFDWVINKSDSFVSDLVAKTVPTARKLSDEKRVHWLKFIANDGEVETIHPVKLTVKNVNQKPEIKDFLPEATIIEQIGVPIIFHVAATDSDGDELIYQWMFDLGQGSVFGSDTIERTYVTYGKKKVTAIVNDGRDSVQKVWNIDVQSPSIQQQPITSQPVIDVPIVGYDTYKVIVVE
jgi:hypothetical protein